MSREELLMTIDAGSGGGRAVVFNAKGEIKARAYRSWGYSSPAGDIILQEFDPAEYWEKICQCAKEALSKVDPKNVKAVSSTSMRQGCLFFDADGQCLYAGPNRDVRGILYALELEEELGKESVCSITCRWPPWMFVPSRLRWFKEEKPEVYAKIAGVLMINDWILYMLSGEKVAEPTNACETMLYDMDKKDWSDELLGKINLPRSALPRLEKSGVIAGQVTAKAEKETGIPKGTLVVAGAADTQAALLACQQTRPLQLGLVAGTTLPVMMTITKPFKDPACKLWSDCHMLDDLYLVESQGGDAGKIFRGYVEGHFGRGMKNNDQKYQEAIKLAEKVPAGSAGARAFLGNLIWDLTNPNPNKPAAILFPFPPEENTSGPGNVARAILEAIAYSAKGNLGQIVDAVGQKPEEALLCGGMTRIKLFNQIVASVLNRPVKVARCKEASALGIAMAAAVGAKIYPELKTASVEMGGFDPEVEPVPEWVEEYESSYDIWRENYDKFEKEW